MDKNLWTIIALLLAIVALICLIFVIYPKDLGNTNGTETTGGTTGTETTDNSENTVSATSFTLVVIHKDGAKKEMTLQTRQAFLGAALIEAGIVEAEENRFGMHIKTADGEKAVFEEDSAYWAVYSGEELAGKSTDLLEIEEGKIYKLVYTAPSPLTSADDPAVHLFYNVFLPIARGHIGTTWQAAKAFAEYMGYEAVIDEGVYSIHVADNRYIRFGGYLTSVGGATLVSATYHVYTDGVDYVRAGVRGRDRNAKDPIYYKENPTYCINENPYTGKFTEVDSLAEVEKYILHYETLSLKFFSLVVQDTFGKPKNTYWVATAEETMGTALEYAGFITVGQGDDGPYIEKVLGQKAATGAAWLLWKGNSYKSLPIDTTPVEEGATYNLVYKRIS